MEILARNDKPMHEVLVKGILSADNGITTIAWLSPILPFINNTEDNLRAF